MARIRTIKPEFWKHEALSELPEATHMLAAALLNYADDEGYFNANPRLIRAECLPLREPSVSVQDSLDALARIAYLRLGDGADGKRYGQIVHFTDHQKINRPSPSKIKAVGISWDGSCIPHAQFTESSPTEGNGKEQGREDAPEELPAPTTVVSRETEKADKRGSRIPEDFEPDTDEAVALGLPLAEAIAEVAKFKDHWKAKAGRDGVKLDWPATWRNWCRRAAEYRATDGRAAPTTTPSTRPTVWIEADDPAFKPACALYERKTGRKAFAAGSRAGNAGIGFAFPVDCTPKPKEQAA